MPERQSTASASTATPSTGLKIILPPKPELMPEKPTHEWYWNNSPRAKGDGKYYRTAYANVKKGWAGDIHHTVFKDLDFLFQQDKALNDAALNNYSSLFALQQTSDKVAADQAQTVQLAQQQQAQQQQQIGAQRLATQAVSQSLQMLAGMAAQAGAPAAAVTRRSPQGLRIRPTGARNSLRIGSSGRGAGVGMNLGG